MKRHLIDHVEFSVKAGNGGKGIIHFRREKYIAKGGPDGGDGGNGGSIYFVANPHMTTLIDFAGHDRFEARNGEAGRARRQHGKDADDVVLEVPVGTVVWAQDEARDDETTRRRDDNELLDDSNQTRRHVPRAESPQPEWLKLADMNEPGMKVLIARGGAGGRGNDAFKSSINTTPQYAEPGQPGQLKQLKLEMKILADVGLVGLPNAGKSTLLSVITAAHPEIANYPFTTVIPNLGVMEVKVHDDDDLSDNSNQPHRLVPRAASPRQLIIADIPGLIEDAHKGKGLGIDFLKHIERCRVLVYVISPTEEDLVAGERDLPDQLLNQFKIVRNEVKSYDHDVDMKPRLVVINKIDVIPKDIQESIIQAFAEIGEQVVTISAATHQGLEELKEEIGKQFAVGDEAHDDEFDVISL